MKNKIFEFVQNQLDCAGVKQVDAVGSFTINDTSPVLFDGAVYGFFARLSEKEALEVFDEAKTKKLLNIDKLEEFKPILDDIYDIYPIYWGRDKSLGKRAYEHLGNPEGNGVIRLSKYECLLGKEMFCFSMTVDNKEKFETYLQKNYPHLLKTTIKKL